jgi:hypothetical protein
VRDHAGLAAAVEELLERCLEMLLLVRHVVELDRDLEVVERLLEEGREVHLPRLLLLVLLELDGALLAQLGVIRLLALGAERDALGRGDDLAVEGRARVGLHRDGQHGHEGQGEPEAKPAARTDAKIADEWAQMRCFHFGSSRGHCDAARDEM